MPAKLLLLVVARPRFAVDADFVVVEVRYLLRRALLFDVALESPPGRLASLDAAPTLLVEVAHQMIDVKILRLAGSLWRLVFFEVFRFGLLAHGSVLRARSNAGTPGRTRRIYIANRRSRQ